MIAALYEDALAELKRALARTGGVNPTWIHRGLAVTYVMLGQEEEGRKYATEALSIDPEHSLKYVAKALSNLYKNQVDIDRYIDALRKAKPPE